MARNLLPSAMIEALHLPRAAVDAWRGETVRLPGMTLQVPGSRRVRLSVVAGNLRMHRLLDRFVRPGATVVDVGANIGYNAVHAARLAGRRGCVVAVEPTPDNVETLRGNVAAAALSNVFIAPVAAGRAAGMRKLFVRGAKSAVNSLFAQSCYAEVTTVLDVRVVPLDQLVDGRADVVKLDVEGAELDVLEGMPRLLRAHPSVVIAEWHPLLQRLAGYGPEALPRWLLERGWRLHAASHIDVRPLEAASVPAFAVRLEQQRKPVELVATHHD